MIRIDDLSDMLETADRIRAATHTLIDDLMPPHLRGKVTVNEVVDNGMLNASGFGFHMTIDGETYRVVVEKTHDNLS